MTHDDNLKVSEAYPELHHYTNRKGLDGIWTSGVLFATRYDCLNDRTEVEHLRDKLAKAVEGRIRAELIKEAADSTKKKLELNEAGGALQVAERESSGFVEALYKTTFRDCSFGQAFAVPHIISFCSHSKDHRYEQENGLLSQWRAYGGEEGFALVFDTIGLEDRLHQEAETFFYSHLRFADVIYNDESVDFEKVCADLIEATVQVLVSGGGSGMEDLFTLFVKGATRFKHRGFREEREVRIIACPQSREFVEKTHKAVGAPIPDGREAKQPHSRQREGRPDTHYIRLFDGNDGRRLPITRIIVGPHRDQSRLCREVRDFTKNAVAVVASETPFVA